MSRPKLIYRTEDCPNFTQGWLMPLVEKYFELVPWNPTVTYDLGHAVLTTYQQDFDPNSWFRGLESRGHRVVVDHLFDSDVDTPSFLINDGKLDLRNGNWMWIRTAILTKFYNYDQYRPQRRYTHDFLCLMNKVRGHRDRVQRDLVPELAHARWSYVDRGIDIGDPQERATPVFWEYYMNPQWYDSTCWHLVIESWMRSDPWFLNPQYPNYKTEVSEKIYKPLSYQQPFIVMGSADTLKFLRGQGFETFDNLWSESYDTVSSDACRLDAVLAQVRDVVKTYNRHSTGWDSITEQKLTHNHAKFYDMNLVFKMFREQVVHDILEFLE